MNYSGIDLSLINKISHDIIVRHLCQNECSKNLIISKDLSKILDTIIKFSELKSYGVSKIFYLENKAVGKGPSDINTEWLYLVKPNVEDIKVICKHIKEDIKMNCLPRYNYNVIFCPRKIFICDSIFEQEGLYEYVKLSELENDLIQFDDDLLSMEQPYFFKDHFLNGDQTWLPSIAKSLINLQNWFGTIPNIHVHGNCAKSVYELMRRYRTISSDFVIDSKSDHKIGHLLLLDRSIDYVTPFCSPLIYEGLLDETFKINAGIIEVPNSSDASKPKVVKLSNSDKVFEDIRCMHVGEVFSHLKTIVANMKNVYEKKNELTSISELKSFINSDLKDYNLHKELVNLHLNISEIVINKKTHIELPIYLTIEHNILRNKEYRRSFEYIEELINRNFDITQVLRLMILLSKTNDGLSSSDYNQLTTQFLHTYGFEKVILLQKLRRLGLIETTDPIITSSKEDSKSNLLKLPQQLSNKLKYSTVYGSIVKKLDIIPGDLSQAQLKSTNKSVDMSYAFNGQYRPILCKYISQILFSEQKGKSNLEEYSKLFPGTYELYEENLSIRTRESNDADRTVLVFFLGGCSLTEIAVLKKLPNKKITSLYLQQHLF